VSGIVQYLFNQMSHGGADKDGVTTAPANPEDVPRLQMLEGLAQQAALEVDARCTGTCNLPWIRGTFIHSAFAAKVNALGPDFGAEVSYKDGLLVNFGTAGSVRADAIYGNPAAPKFVVDLKTGLFNYMSRGEAKAYIKHTPGGTDIYWIKVR
jgi:hypothetical protein